MKIYIFDVPFLQKKKNPLILDVIRYNQYMLICQMIIVMRHQYLSNNIISTLMYPQNTKEK